MSRWIDVDEFKAFLGEVRARYNLFSDEERPHYEAYSKALYILNEYLEDAPSIDLVHCGECRYCEEYKSMVGTEYICDRIWCSPYDWADRPGFYVSLDDFCSRGERKETE